MALSRLLGSLKNHGQIDCHLDFVRNETLEISNLSLIMPFVRVFSQPSIFIRRLRLWPGSFVASIVSVAFFSISFFQCVFFLLDWYIFCVRKNISDEIFHPYSSIPTHSVYVMFGTTALQVPKECVAHVHQYRLQKFG